MALGVLGAATASATRSDEHQRTIHFVLRPDGAVSDNDLPGTLEALESDGPLVQSVIGVLGSRAMLQRAATEAGLPFSRAYKVESTGRPGSALIDSTLVAPDEAVVDRLADGYTRAAANYVAASYTAYTLERLSAEAGGDGPGPSTAQVMVLALLVGGLLGVGLVAAELRFAPRLRALVERIPTSQPDGLQEGWSNGGRGRRGPVLRALKSLGAPPETKPTARSTSAARPKSASGAKPAARSKSGARSKSPARPDAAAPPKRPARTEAAAGSKSATRPKKSAVPSESAPAPEPAPASADAAAAPAKAAASPEPAAGPPESATPAEPVSAPEPAAREPAARTDPPDRPGRLAPVEPTSGPAAGDGREPADSRSAHWPKSTTRSKTTRPKPTTPPKPTRRPKPTTGRRTSAPREEER